MGKATKLKGTTKKAGRPRGRTNRGHEAKKALYQTAVGLIAERGFEATTLRDIADRAGVSVGLLYKYFPGKSAIVLALYDELSAQYAEKAVTMPAGNWRDRFLFALRTSMEILAPHRATLSGLLPVLVGNAEEGIFAPSTDFSRARVQTVFIAAVAGASDGLGTGRSESLGRVLYFFHLTVLLGWLLDRSPGQRATLRLVAALEKNRRAVGFALALPFAKRFVRFADDLLQEGLYRQ